MRHSVTAIACHKAVSGPEYIDVEGPAAFYEDESFGLGRVVFGVMGRAMKPSIQAVVVLGVTFCLGTMVTNARAQSGAGVLLVAANDFASSNYGPGPVTTGRTLEWDSRKGRWGLKLGVEQRTDQLSEWRDVQPGLYYKVTPRLHIGGAVSLSPEPTINPRLADPQASNPRVRLETTFKF
jgi:hypothetical protein